MNTSQTIARTVAAVAVIGTGSLLIAGHAGADWQPDPLCIYSSAEDKAADLADDGLENCSILDDQGTIVDPNLLLPYLPEGDDGPDITLNPNVSIPLNEQPGDDDGPGITLNPNVSIPLNDLPELPELPELPGDPPADQPADQPADLPATPEAPQPPSTTQPASPAPEDVVVPVVPFVRITSAVVECDGSVLVGYETEADPSYAPTAEHVVSFSPTAVPSLAFSQRIVGQPLNAAFNLDVPTPSAAEYLVFVVADFQPGNPDGVVLVDEAVAAAPANCPAS